MDRVVLFDFDGTVADSMDAVVRVANRLAAELGTPRVAPEDIARLRQQQLRQVLREARVPLWKLPWMLQRVRRELRQEIATIQPIAGMPETLRQLQQQGFRLGILTSNARSNVAEFLHERALTDVFEIACSEASIFGKGRMLRRCLRQYDLAADRTTYVGDETRDIEAARRNGVRAIAVEWGFNTRQPLLDCKPDGIARHPAELLNLLVSHSSDSVNSNR
ncbi:HAD hydrolase-like protein [Synechococcus sp. PCC 7336]|uniref:HAD hydrolase-like protein n=1 Tax=Synechococcus sp. PCC 7336 TaxID=195250 RepID=UPI000344D28E|nr:HAD hydrolase-like protein [Synechococcus sp. PCC 7336]